VKELEPQLVRIFYNDNCEENRDGTHPEYQQNYDSFVKVVQLAQEAGATILISYQNLAYARLYPDETMATYAGVLEDLVRTHGFTNVRWVEVGNEPNDPNGSVTLDQYNALYRALNAQLVARGLRKPDPRDGRRTRRELRRQEPLRLAAVDRPEHGGHRRRVLRAHLLVVRQAGSARVPANAPPEPDPLASA
jgi:hypothetical protein